MPRVLPPPHPNESREPAPSPKRWTRRECDFLRENGLLTERYELIDGEIISKMGQKPPHAYVVSVLMDWLISLFGSLHVRIQSSINIGDADPELNDPEPDAVVTAQPAIAYAERHPGPADLLLAVEVSDTTLRFDLRNKALLYARAGIAEYWVADIAGRRFVAHRQPAPEGYREVLEYAEEELLSLSARPDAAARVADLLPPA